jgi:NagD protein
VHSDVVRERLLAACGFVFDMDGTLVLGDRHHHGLSPLPGALEITRWAERHGRPFVVFTNGTIRTPAHYARTMRDIGFGLPDEAMLTPASSAVRVFVKAGYQRVMVLGGPALAEVPMAHRGRSLAIAVGTGLGGSASWDGVPVSRRPHLRVRAWTSCWKC